MSCSSERKGEREVSPVEENEEQTVDSTDLRSQLVEEIRREPVERSPRLVIGAMKLLGGEIDDVVESLVGERSRRSDDVGSWFAVDESGRRGRSIDREG